MTTEATLASIAELLGDDPSQPPGAHFWRLDAEAKSGRLATTDDPLWIEHADYKVERPSVADVRVSKAALAAWLAAHGTPADQASPAAAWAAS